MPSTSENVSIDQIPFQKKSLREELRELDRVLGGVHIAFTPRMPSAPDQCYLRLNVAAQKGKTHVTMEARGALPDAAFEQIKRKIFENCVTNKLPLVVENHPQRTFKVSYLLNPIDIIKAA